MSPSCVLRKKRAWSLGEPPDSSESGEHLQFCSSVFASFPRAVIWLWECSSQGAFLKLSRVPRLYLNNRTRRGVPPSRANLLVSYYLCSAFLCIEPLPIWNWILRLWFPTLHLLWFGIFSQLTQYLTIIYVGRCFLYVQCFGELSTFLSVSELSPSPASWPGTGLWGRHL